jgi:LCP family protein required for cell wall assembly
VLTQWKIVLRHPLGLWISRPGGRPTQRILRSAACLVLLCLVTLPRPGSAPPRQPAFAAHPATAAARPAPVPPVPPGDARFLIVGLTQDRHRTDTLMVVQWDSLHRAARILGVPRDTGVSLGKIGTTKIVHAYATGGIGRAREAVVRLLGVPVAHYFVFSLPAMRHLVDLIGGVPVTVEKNMVYTDRQQGLFINLRPGPQVLNGARAEQYLRFRNDAEGDIGRIRRQKLFLRAALATVRRPAEWIRLPGILETARAEVETDLTSAQLFGWLRRVDGLSPDAIAAHTIEGRPIMQWDDLARMKLDFWQPDPDDLRAKVRWLVTGAVPPLTVP